MRLGRPIRVRAGKGPDVSGESVRETEIRPDELMAEQSAAYRRDVQRLLGRRDQFVEVACPGCDSARSRMTMQKFGVDYLECLDCRTVYLSPRPGPSVLSEYYATSENYEYWNKFIFPASEEVRRQKIFRPRAERVVQACERHGIRLGTLVDVGAGFGTFCEEVRGSFEKVLAIEPTPDLARTCRERGLNVIDRPVEAVELDDQVDVVTAFEVIEHLFDPKLFLERCRSFMKTSGLVVLSCPNVEGFDIAMLRELSTAVDLEHLNYFTPSSLTQLVRSCGFQPVEVTTPGQLDAELVRKAVLRDELDLSGDAFLRTVLLDRWDEVGDRFQAFLAENGLSSHLWVMATSV